MLSTSLLSRINALEAADVLHDIVIQRQFRFHELKGKLKGYFSMDVKNISDPYRIILEPLDENEEPHHPCHLDEISKTTKTVKIMEVSKHYE